MDDQPVVQYAILGKDYAINIDGEKVIALHSLKKVANTNTLSTEFNEAFDAMKRWYYDAIMAKWLGDLKTQLTNQLLSHQIA